MKNTFFFALALATVLGACDQVQTSDQSTTNTETAAAGATTQPVAVNNPNVTASQEMASSEQAPVMTFDKEEHDFGNIGATNKVTHTFSFTNTGQTPLVIQSASATCGCTVPEWPKEPIAPGQGGKISVEFDPSGKAGQQAKQVTIRANTQPELVYLNIKANIQGGAATAGAMGPVRSDN